MTYAYYCDEIRRRITRRPLRACESCKNLIMVDCPGYEPKQFANTDADMSRFFSRCKGGESASKPYCAEEPDCKNCESDVDCGGQHLRSLEEETVK